MNRKSAFLGTLAGMAISLNGAFAVEAIPTPTPAQLCVADALEWRATRPEVDPRADLISDALQRLCPALDSETFSGAIDRGSAADRCAIRFARYDAVASDRIQSEIEDGLGRSLGAEDYNLLRKATRVTRAIAEAGYFLCESME